MLLKVFQCDLICRFSFRDVGYLGVDTVCLPGVYPSAVDTVCLPGVYPSAVDTVCLPGVYPSGVDTVCL
ncbi:hypothetical protein ACFQ40_02270, partial [Kroppenstedtia eburnea]